MSLLGIVVIGALATSLAHAWLVRKRRRAFVPAALAFACLAAVLVAGLVATLAIPVETWSTGDQAMRRRWLPRTRENSARALTL